MTKILPGLRTVSSDAVEVVAIDESFELDSGETLTGTPTVTEIDTNDLTITNNALNASSMTINGNTAAANCAVLFRISGQKAGKLYNIKYTVNTTSTPARTLAWIVRIQCR